ncbi:MAG: hypothetical protein AAGE84_32030, partial [Cyanobacteria bacterium P01_G01_bin.39]
INGGIMSGRINNRLSVVDDVDINNIRPVDDVDINNRVSDIALENIISVNDLENIISVNDVDINNIRPVDRFGGAYNQILEAKKELSEAIDKMDLDYITEPVNKVYPDPTDGPQIKLSEAKIQLHGALQELEEKVLDEFADIRGETDAKAKAKLVENISHRTVKVRDLIIGVLSQSIERKKLEAAKSKVSKAISLLSEAQIRLQADSKHCRDTCYKSFIKFSAEQPIPIMTGGILIGAALAAAIEWSIAVALDHHDVDDITAIVAVSGGVLGGVAGLIYSRVAAHYLHIHRND